MFSHQMTMAPPKMCAFGSSETRFKKAAPRPDVGPGSYEVPSLLNISCNASMLDLDASTFSIFVDEDMEKNAPRTPRSARKPFSKSTKENVISSNVKVSEISNERVKELQKTVEHLESKCRALQLKKDSEGQQEGAEGEAPELRSKLMQSSKKNEQLRELFEAATERVQSLEATAANLPTNPNDVAALVEKLVMHELANPRKVFCLQRKVWEDQVKCLQEQTNRLENQEDTRSKFYQQREQILTLALARATVAENVAAEEQRKAVEAECRAAEEQARAAAAECRAIEAETTAGAEKEEIMRLRAEVARLKDVSEHSLLEQQRLTEMVAVTQDAMERYREREAELAGHTNHQQKIRLTMRLKKENDTLRLEVERLQKQLFHQQPPRQHRQTAVTPRSSLLAEASPAATAKACMDDSESW